MNPGSDINLIDLIDGYIRLYGPVFAKLMDDYPDVAGIGACIGRDKPVACPTDDEGTWYGMPEFEARAGADLAPLVEATKALQASCSVTVGRREPVSISTERAQGGEILIRVSVANKLGGLHVQRIAMQVPELPAGVFFLTEGRITLVTDSKSAETSDILSLAANDGFANVVRAAVEAGTLHNQHFDDVATVDTWLEAFPLEDGTPVAAEPITERFCHWTAVSSYKPGIILASQAIFDSVSKAFLGHHIEPLELDVESFTVSP